MSEKTKEQTTGGNDDGTRSASLPLLRATDLCKHFPLRRGLFSGKREVLRAVEGVSLAIARGETLGLVGESGCGKTTLGRVILRLLPATSGRVLFDGIDLAELGASSLRRVRRRMQIIFQDPFSSLNPRMTVEQIVSEGIRVFSIARGREATSRVAAMLERVGLPADALHRFPHEFSGGQRQRIGIARALAIDPEFVVCDEPVSALDVSVQAQVINLLVDLRESMGLSYLFISHDLSVVKHIADRVAVMYLGRIVEAGEAGEVFSDPRHPYTRALISAVPLPEPGGARRRIILDGDVPSPINPPPGCPFHPRCPEAKPECARDEPPVRGRIDGSFRRCIL